MSNFPFNYHKYQGSDMGRKPNGSPLNWVEVRSLAENIRTWHSQNDTDDWTQSYDGTVEDIVHLALGLMEMLSDPGAVRRLIMSGSAVRKPVDILLKNITDNDDPSIDVVRDLFSDV